MADYNKSIIYKLVDRETGNTYFGATREPINRRISKHRCRKSCKCRDIITKNDFDVEVLEEYETDEIDKHDDQQPGKGYKGRHAPAPCRNAYQFQPPEHHYRDDPQDQSPQPSDLQQIQVGIGVFD